eukprot:UN16371
MEQNSSDILPPPPPITGDNSTPTPIDDNSPKDNISPTTAQTTFTEENSSDMPPPPPITEDNPNESIEQQIDTAEEYVNADSEEYEDPESACSADVCVKDDDTFEHFITDETPVNVEHETQEDKESFYDEIIANR